MSTKAASSTRTATFTSAFAALVGAVGLSAWSADPVNSAPTAIKAPECILDPSALFFSENTVPANPPHPTRPIGHYSETVRYLGPSSVALTTGTDFGHLSPYYAWPPFQGHAVTGFTPPDPVYPYQRTSRYAATPDNASAFQLSCYDAGSFINTFTFPELEVSGGGAHSIYGYSFDVGHLPPVYDNNPGTDFGLQASVEVPWFYSAADPTAAPGVVSVAQVSLFAYFLDVSSGKTFALLVGIYDNREAGPVAPT